MTIEPLYLKVGQRIARLRNKRGLTQEMLAASMQPPLTRASICNIEGAKQRIMLTQLVDIADALGTTVGRLLK